MYNADNTQKQAEIYFYDVLTLNKNAFQILCQPDFNTVKGSISGTNQEKINIWTQFIVKWGCLR